MIKKNLLVILFSIIALLQSSFADALSTRTLGNGGSTVTKTDARECPIFFGDLSKYVKDENFTFEIKQPSIDLGIYDIWLYTSDDAYGKRAYCWDSSPSVNERVIFERVGETIDDVKYRIFTSYCTARYTALQDILDEDLTGYCGDEDTDDWSGAHYEVDFSPGEVVANDADEGNKTMWWGGAAGWNMCLKRVKPGETYKHTGTKNESGIAQVCAYTVFAGNNQCNNPFGLWSEAFYGCVDEIPLPGPDVMNPVLPSKLSPFVDVTRCMDSVASGPSGCDSTKPNLISSGSTFDKPVVPIIDGQNNTLYLQYQFKDDFTDSEIPTCSTFLQADSSLLDTNINYCAQVPLNEPNKVCACEARNDGSAYLSEEYINHCGANPIIGCVDRPTLEHSKLKMVVETDTVIDPVRGTKYPAIRPAFVRTGTDGKILYVDESGADICLGSENDYSYFKCPNGVASTTPATGNKSYKERLRLPLISTKIKEYTPKYPATDIPITCLDQNNTAVIINYDGEFYTLDSANKMTTTKAFGTVKCKLNGVDIDLGGAKPSGYAKDNETIYGIPFEAMIPITEGTSPDETIKYGRYTSARDVPGASICTPLKNTSICDPRGTTHFFPAGIRDTAFCYIHDLTTGQCAGYRIEHDSDASKLFCPGMYKNASSATSGNRICLKPSTNWKFKTVADYVEQSTSRSAVDLFQMRCTAIESTELCIGIDLGCDKILTPSRDSGLAIWTRDLQANGGGQATTCLAEYGLTGQRQFSVIENFFLQDNVCQKKPANKTCEEFYAEFEADRLAINDALEVRKKSLATVDMVEMQTAEIISMLSPLFNKYITTTDGNVSFWIAPSPPRYFTPFRFCQSGGYSRYVQNCVMQASCGEITKEAEFTGFATWSKANIDSVILNTTTVNANRGRTVDLRVKGTCGANYRPKAGTTQPERTCTVTYNADGSIYNTKWKLPIDTPCEPR